MCSFDMAFINVFMTTCASGRACIFASVYIFVTCIFICPIKLNEHHIAEKYYHQYGKHHIIALSYFSYPIQHDKILKQYLKLVHQEDKCFGVFIFKFTKKNETFPV